MQPHLHDHKDNAAEGTNRIETYSDGVYAIVATLLILELHVPSLLNPTNGSLLEALREILPEFLAFVLSFAIIAIYWVNHHHFFHSVERTDWKLLWYNNFHLFWIATIPFTTAFIGRYHTETVPIVLYAFDMAMAALSIMLMIRYVFFKSTLMDPGFSQERKRKEFRRGFIGVYLYLAAAVGALFFHWLALAIFAITPFLFVVPQLLSHEEE